MTASPVPGVSVIIAALNAEATLDDQLAALAAQDFTGDYEVIVADNGSTDATASVAEQWSQRDPRFRLVDASERRGCGAARNIAAGQARGALLAFCDADDVVEPQWLTAFAQADTGDCQLAGPIDSYALAKRPNVNADQSRFEVQRISDLPVATGACSAIPATLFAQVGGYDETIAFGEDVALSLTLYRAGSQVRFVPQAVVRRRPRDTRRALWRQWVRYGGSSVEVDRRFPEYARRFPAVSPDSGLGPALRFAATCLRHPLRYQTTWITVGGFYWGKTRANRSSPKPAR